MAFSTISSVARVTGAAADITAAAGGKGDLGRSIFRSVALLVPAVGVLFDFIFFLDDFVNGKNARKAFEARLANTIAGAVMRMEMSAATRQQDIIFMAKRIIQSEINDLNHKRENERRERWPVGEKRFSKRLDRYTYSGALGDIRGYIEKLNERIPALESSGFKAAALGEYLAEIAGRLELEPRTIESFELERQADRKERAEFTEKRERARASKRAKHLAKTKAESEAAQAERYRQIAVITERSAQARRDRAVKFNKQQAERIRQDFQRVIDKINANVENDLCSLGAKCPAILRASWGPGGSLIRHLFDKPYERAIKEDLLSIDELREWRSKLGRAQDRIP